MKKAKVDLWFARDSSYGDEPDILWICGEKPKLEYGEQLSPSGLTQTVVPVVKPGRCIKATIEVPVKPMPVPSHPEDITEAMVMMIEAVRKRQKCSLLEAAAIVRRCWAKAAMEYAARMKNQRTKE